MQLQNYLTPTILITSILINTVGKKNVIMVFHVEMSFVSLHIYKTDDYANIMFKLYWTVIQDSSVDRAFTH